MEGVSTGLWMLGLLRTAFYRSTTVFAFFWASGDSSAAIASSAVVHRANASELLFDQCHPDWEVGVIAAFVDCTSTTLRSMSICNILQRSDVFLTTRSLSLLLS